MGSSPVTATNSVRRFFAGSLAPSADELLGLAFSGGPDSLALLHILRLIFGPHRLVALHVDHAIPGSRGRAGLARALARRAGVAFLLREVEVDRLKGRNENWEAAARRLRYLALAEMADAAGVVRIATAHHAQDQAETLLQRLQRGSDWMGLSAILPQQDRWLRPALGLSRSELRSALADSGSMALEDPTNRSLARQRARVRHVVLPHLAALEGSATRLSQALGQVAESARQAREKLHQSTLDLPTGPPGGALDRLAHWLSATRYAVPQPGRRALTSGQRRGRGHTASAAAQSGVPFHGRGAVQWSGVSPVSAPGARTPSTPFSYSFQGPGELDIPEIGLRLSLFPEAAADWMFEGRRGEVGLVFAGVADPEVPSAGERGPIVEVRSRRPGDRLQVLGMTRSRRLKDVLIDRKIPAGERDRIPLLCHQGKIAWVPGVTVGELFRLRDEATCWVASLRPISNG